MVDIQKDAEWAIQNMQAAANAQISGNRAEMENRLNAAWLQQQDAIAKTSQANATSWASYIESINNIITTANKSGMDMDVKGFEQAALAMQGMTEDQKQAYLSNFEEKEQYLLMGLANQPSTTEAPTVKNMWTAKSPKRMQRDWSKWVAVSWWGGFGWWGGWGGWGGWWWGNVWIAKDWTQVSFDPWLASVYNTVNQGKSLDIQRFSKIYWIPADQLTKQAQAYKYSTLSDAVGNALDTVDGLNIKYPWRALAMSADTKLWRVAPWLADFFANYKFIKDNLTMDKLIALKTSWATFWALSDSEREAIGNAANAITLSMSEWEFKKQLWIIQKTLTQSIGWKDPRKWGW